MCIRDRQSASATELIGSMRKLVPYVTTSLSPTDMASLIVGAVKNGIPTLEHTDVYKRQVLPAVLRQPWP